MVKIAIEVGVECMTKTISEIKGKAVVVRGNDIDTDRIIPARYMKEVSFAPLGKYVFYDVRFDEHGNALAHPFNQPEFKDASLLIVNKNFGCGSSREHAPQSLMRWGIRGMIGESFAEIFSGNCTMLGMPILTLPKDEIESLMAYVEAHPQEELLLDVREQKLKYDGKVVHGAMSKSSQKALMEGTWDSTSMLLQGKTQIHDKAAQLPYLNHFPVNLDKG